MVSCMACGVIVWFIHMFLVITKYSSIGTTLCLSSKCWLVNWPGPCEQYSKADLTHCFVSVHIRYVLWNTQCIRYFPGLILPITQIPSRQILPVLRQKGTENRFPMQKRAVARSREHTKEILKKKSPIIKASPCGLRQIPHLLFQILALRLRDETVKERDVWKLQS